MCFRHARALALVALVAIGGLLVAAVADHPPPPAAAAPLDTAPAAPTVTAPAPPAPVEPPPIGEPARGDGRLGVQDGVVPDGVTVFDNGYPAVTRLDPALLTTLRRAASDAAEDGVTIHVKSGWRSSTYQDRLLQQAVAKYGSAEEAARWVATADTSMHVSGDAVDVGTSGVSWLARHGAAYGLCQTYGNEPWHYELFPDAVGHGCPAMYADPTHDPRMQ